MDNRQFNVNGKTKTQLDLAISLLLHEDYDINSVAGYYFSENVGLVLTWFVGKNYIATPFTNRMGIPTKIYGNELTEILWEWLKTDQAKRVKLDGWDNNEDHDGSNDLGWRLYTQDWGHINDNNGITCDHYSIAAIKPSYLWYGK